MRAAHSLAFLAILATIGLVHRPILEGWFQVDDFLWLRLAHFGDVLNSFAGTWGHGVAYRPVMRVSFYLDDLLFGWHGEWWHAENLLIGALDGFLLYLFARRLGLDFAAALAAACLFVAAPIGVENIDWISGRTGLLSLGFLLGASILWLDGHVAAVAALLVLGLATYEAMLVLPLVLILLLPFRRHIRSILVIAGAGMAFWLLRSILLGTFGAKVDAPMPSVWSAIVENVPTYPDMIGMLWDGDAVGALALGMVIGSLHRRFRPVVWTMLAMSAALVLPFLMAKGWGARFSFAMQAPLCIILAVPVAAIPTRLRFAYLAVIGVVLSDFAPDSYRQAAAMAQAGRFDREIVEKAAAIPTEPWDTMIFAGIPDSFAGRMAISTKFTDAMAARTPRPGLTLREEDMIGRPDLTDFAAKTRTRHFRFDPERREFDETP